MRIGGVEVKGPNEEILVLPRMDGDIIIKAQAVNDMKMFDDLVSEPKPPVRLTKNGKEDNVKDKTYLEKVARYNQLRFTYMVVQSLIPSEIEWETVKLDEPKTWPNWETELRDAGISEVEINRITVCVMQANSLDEAKLKAAREVFLRGTEEEVEDSSGPQTEPESTPSGEPVKE